MFLYIATDRCPKGSKEEDKSFRMLRTEHQSSQKKRVSDLSYAVVARSNERGPGLVELPLIHSNDRVFNVAS